MSKDCCMDKKEALEVFDGLMLGDGGLLKYRGGARFCMVQSKVLAPKHYPNQEQLKAESLMEHMKWLQWIAENPFKVLGIPVCKDHPKILTRTWEGKPYQYAFLETPQSPVLVGMWDEWYTGGKWATQYQLSQQYIQGAIKVVPKRLMREPNISTNTLMQWFRGDGGGGWEYQRGRTPNRHVDFATNCFTEEEVCHLTAMLNNAGLNTNKPSRKVQIRGSGLRIFLSADSIDSFMNLIEPHVREVFGPGSLTCKDMIIRWSDFMFTPRDRIFDILRTRLRRADFVSEGAIA